MPEDGWTGRRRALLPAAPLAALLLVPLEIGTVSALAWQVETVDPVGSAGMFSSQALDGEGNPRNSYVDGNNDLKYAAHDGAAWRLETVDAEAVDLVFVGWYSSALDGAGNPRTSYLDYSSMDLEFARADIPPAVVTVPGGSGLPTDTNGDGRRDFADVVWLFHNL